MSDIQIKISFFKKKKKKITHFGEEKLCYKIWNADVELWKICCRSTWRYNYVHVETYSYVRIDQVRIKLGFVNNFCAQMAIEQRRRNGMHPGTRAFEYVPFPVRKWCTWPT